MLKIVHGESVMSRADVFRWYNQFLFRIRLIRPDIAVLKIESENIVDRFSF